MRCLLTSAITVAFAGFLLASQVVAAQALTLKKSAESRICIPPWGCWTPLVADEAGFVGFVETGEPLYLTDEQFKMIEQWGEWNKKIMEEAEKKK